MDDVTANPGELRDVEFTAHGKRLRALAAEATTPAMRELYAGLAKTYDKLAATYQR